MLHFLALLAMAAVQNAPLTAQSPIVVPGAAGKFDFMNIDAANRRVFAAHPQTSTFAVVNLKNGKVKSVDTGVAVNGIDADSANRKVFAAGPGKTLVEFDAKGWHKVAELPLDGPGDSVLYDSKNSVVYVDNDDGTNLWVVDPSNLKVIDTITIKEAPEVMVLDQQRGKIFQNIKSTNSVQVIDTNSRKVVDEYSLGELNSPHGLAEDAELGRLFSVGKNGKLVVLDASNGKILQTLDVTKNSDQIAYDAGLKRLYIPGSGVIEVVQVNSDGAQSLGTVPVDKSCHSITVDPQTHDVWVAYSDGKQSLVQKFTTGS